MIIHFTGGNKRPGAFAIYLEPWHADIFEFLDAKKNTGTEETRARDLFYALWVPDLFMKRVESHGKWTLFCPDEAPGLPDTYGEEFEALYEKYEKEGRGRKTIDAQELWSKIIEAQQGNLQFYAKISVFFGLFDKNLTRTFRGRRSLHAVQGRLQQKV